MEKINTIYKILYKEYNARGWWPINGKYEKLYTLNEEDKFEIAIGAILTQNTSWNNVEKALESLRKNNLLNKEKLKKFTVNVAPSLAEKGKIPQLLRKSVNSYLGREKDERLTVLASRYAWQLDKSNKLSEKVFLFFDKEFSMVARLEVIDRIKTVVEQKQEVILDAIYDGKYEYAKMECELVIALEPDNALAWKRFGSVYYALGKRTDAKTCWQEAMKINPDDAETKKFLERIK